MLLKNKFSDRDKDKDRDKDNDKYKDKTSTEDKDNTTTKTKTEDKIKATTKTKNKTISKAMTMTKDKDEATPKTKAKDKDKDEDTDRYRNKFIQVFKYSKRRYNKKNSNWKKRQIVWAFWNDGHVSELCEKWVHYGNKYAYTRFEELRTYSVEVLFTREHKAIASKDKSNTHINIDKLSVFKDLRLMIKIH